MMNNLRSGQGSVEANERSGGAQENTASKSLKMR